MKECYIVGNFIGYYDENGKFIVIEEIGLTDADTDKYAIEVMNGDGYYDENGSFHYY